MREVNAKYIKLDNSNPFVNIDKIYDDTIILPDLSEFPLSETKALDDWKFSEFFDNLIFNFNNFPSMKSVCNVYYNKIEEYFLRIDLTTLELSVSNNTISQIQNCIDSSVHIIILPIRLDLLDIQTDYNVNFTESDTNPNSSHSNLLIIDTVWKTIDFFEPHGIVFGHTYSNIINLQETVEFFVKNIFAIQDYTFVNIANACPIGLQTLQTFINPQSGHCLVWSLYFITVRLMNTNYIHTDFNKTISQTINELLVKNFSSDADTTIRQFLTYIENTISIQTRTYTDQKYDLLTMLSSTDVIEHRLRYLIRMYFFNIILYNKDFKKIFREIVSYKNLKNFDKIFIEEMSNNFISLNQSDFTVDPGMISN
jgi:hypothetical protein